MGGKCSRKACCLSCRRAGTNLQGIATRGSLPRQGRGRCATAQWAEAAGGGWGCALPRLLPSCQGPPPTPLPHPKPCPTALTGHCKCR